MQLDSTVADAFLLRALSYPDDAWRAVSEQGGDWDETQFARATSAAARIQAATGGRVGIAEGVQAKSPYVKWTLRDLEKSDGGGVRGRNVQRLMIEARVCRVDIYIDGQGSFAQARQTQTDLLDCLIGVPCTPIRLSDGTLIGAVTMSRFRATHRRSYPDETTAALILELGAVLEISLENLS